MRPDSAALRCIDDVLVFSYDYSKYIHLVWSTTPAASDYAYWIVEVIDSISGKLVMKAPNLIRRDYDNRGAFQFNQDSTKVLVLRNAIFDWTSGTLIQEIPPKVTYPRGIVNRKLTGFFALRAKFGSNKNLVYYDINSGKELWSIAPGHYEGQFTDIAPNDSTIALIINKTLKIADMNASKIIDIQVADPVHAIFSRDGQSLFVSSLVASSIWSSIDGKCMYVNQDSYSITASIDNSILFILGKDNVIRIYDAGTMQQISEIQSELLTKPFGGGWREDELRSYTKLMISADGKKLAIHRMEKAELWTVA